MKIACQSCQAKYTIADEKVLGKVVKIRCKKCGATIVVNGQDTGDAAHIRASAFAGEEATEVRGSSADFGGPPEGEPWTVNVADDDQRTMTTQQVVAEFSHGTITDETYCWRDGMGDWLPLREVEELATACGLNAASAFAQQAAPAPQVQQPVAAARTPSVRPQPAGGGGLFGSSPPAAMAAQPAAAARRAGARAGGADLFGAAAEAGGENDVMTSAPQNAGGRAVDDGKMTGQRNENSVLFSLNALTAAEPKKGPAGKPLGAAEGDGSGLIDIRALSSAMASTGPKKANHADDIMNLGGGGAFSAALAAPVLTAPVNDPGDPGAPSAGIGNQKLFMMFGGLAALLILGMVIMFFALQPKTPPLAAAPAEGTSAGTTPGAPGSAAATAPTAPAASVAANDPGAAAPAPTDNAPKASAPSVGVKPRSTGGGTTSNTVAANNTPAPPPPSPGNQSLDALMQKSVGGGTAPAPPPPPTGGTDPFNRGAAAASIGAILGTLESCKRPGGPTGEGHISITFSPSGTVKAAVVDQPPYAGTAVGGCIAGKFRSAHVPPFAGGDMPVGKRFSIN